jgi:hypothetical protein
MKNYRAGLTEIDSRVIFGRIIFIFGVDFDVDFGVDFDVDFGVDFIVFRKWSRIASGLG